MKLASRILFFLIFFISSISLGYGVAAFATSKLKGQDPLFTVITGAHNTPIASITPTIDPQTSPTALETLPESMHLSVPFLVQAPYGKWDALHEDACEETSLIMVEHFLKGTPLDAAGGDAQIHDLINLETSKGLGTSITVEQLNALASSHYGLQGTVSEDSTIQTIKAALAAGKPVIVGAAGKELSQPYFIAGGPVYHMLVIIGYDGTDFITNDPGVRQGRDFRYNQDNLFKAIHNWNPANIDQGQKSMLTFSL